MLLVAHTRADDRRQVTTRLGCEEKLREPRLSKTAVAAWRNERLREDTQSFVVEMFTEANMSMCYGTIPAVHRMYYQNIVFGALVRSSDDCYLYFIYC